MSSNTNVMTKEEFCQRLQNRMHPEAFQEMRSQLTYEWDNSPFEHQKRELFGKIIEPKVKQVGMKFVVKQRPMFLDPEGNCMRITPKMTDEVIEEMAEAMSFGDWEEKHDYVAGLYIAKGLAKRIHHAGIFVNGQIYHYGKAQPWRMYGLDETNKEACNDKWRTHSDLDKTFYTLRTHDEIQAFCDRWDKNGKYNIATYNCQHFMEALFKFLVVCDFNQ